MHQALAALCLYHESEVLGAEDVVATLCILPTHTARLIGCCLILFIDSLELLIQNRILVVFALTLTLRIHRMLTAAQVALTSRTLVSVCITTRRRMTAMYPFGIIDRYLIIHLRHGSIHLLMLLVIRGTVIVLLHLAADVLV